MDVRVWGLGGHFLEEFSLYVFSGPRVGLLVAENEILTILVMMAQVGRIELLLTR